MQISKNYIEKRTSVNSINTAIEILKRSQRSKAKAKNGKISSKMLINAKKLICDHFYHLLINGKDNVLFEHIISYYSYISKDNLVIEISYNNQINDNLDHDYADLFIQNNCVFSIDSSANNTISNLIINIPIEIVDYIYNKIYLYCY